MIDQKLMEQFIRSKVLLQEKLGEIGIVPGSPEIENQMKHAGRRMEERIMQGLRDSIEEMNALRFILNEIVKDDE